MVTHNHAKAFAGTRGGGGGEMIFLKKCLQISIYLNVKLIVLPQILHL